MSVLFTNNASATLASNINNSTTTIPLSTGAGALFPSPTGSDYFLATLQEGNTIEIVKCTARSTDTLTVVRAQEGTSGSAFTSAATLDLRLTAGGIGVLAQIISGLLKFTGSIELDTTGQNAVNFNYTGSLGSESNPSFRVGRLVSAGINLPELRIIYYSDTVGAERVIWAIESDGTGANVGDGNRHSLLEGYTGDGDYKPGYRYSMWPLCQNEYGAGGSYAAIGHVTRASNVVTVNTGSNPHGFSPGDYLYIVSNGDPLFSDSAGIIPVASVPDTTHFTYNDTGSNGSNTVLMDYSIETDIAWRRQGSQHLALIMGPGTGGQSVAVEFYADSMVTASGYGASYGGSILLQPTTLHHSDSPYSLVAGSTYLLDCSSGAITVNLPAANSYFGKPGRMVWFKKIDSSGNAVTISAAGSDKIDGAGSVTLGSQYKYVVIESDGSANWYVWGSN